MRLISRKHLKDFCERHPDAKAPLDAWYHEVKRANWKNFADIRLKYRSADVVAGNRVIFNIGGNKYRLVVKVAYKVGVVYVKFVGTHEEYDKIDVREVDQT